MEHFRWRILESQLRGAWGRIQKGLMCRLWKDIGLLALMIFYLIVRNMAKEGQSGLPKAQAVQKIVPLQGIIR